MGWVFHRKSTDNLERLETLERAFKTLRLEWDDAYDKMRTITARFTKRAEAIAAAQTDAAATETGVPHAMDPVSQRIIDRRNRMMPRREQ